MFLLSLAAYVSSAPIAPAASVAPSTSVLDVASATDEDQRVGWTSNPTGRGTSKIITSCTFTLALCIWTAIHPDLVRKTKPKKTTGNDNTDSSGSKPVTSSPAAAGAPPPVDGDGISWIGTQRSGRDTSPVPHPENDADTTPQSQTSSPANATTTGMDK
ncbi:uncharacterized protein LAJ45_01202 [Morchella importuna]|uniref:uncharacterized protein n=1 Tax=Morchella importuna TaxID=1174673 RepID=UPI001E8ECE13|nr:uncharacterized protein LAJ45_01202 [Morchella importuna]KAH8154673.1 hypothetical protein LAJ45_01202 [Morchella importuna]